MLVAAVDVVVVRNMLVIAADEDGKDNGVSVLVDLVFKREW